MKWAENRQQRLGDVRERHRGGLAVRVLHRLVAINGYDRALAISAQAFVGVIPVLVVASAASPHSFRESAGNAVIVGLGLSGDAATTMSGLVQRPPAVEPLTVAGCVLLVVSVLGFTRALQRTYLSAWELPATGLRGLGHGLLAAAALVGGFAALVLLWPVIAVFGGYVVIELILYAIAATLLWWPIQRILLDGRVGWRVLLPGAVLNGCGQAVVVGLSVIYLPSAITSSSAQYGLIGVAVPVISWLIVLGLLLVVSAVLGVEMAREPTLPQGPPDISTDRAEQDLAES